MKLPRGISGRELAKRLRLMGYEVTRQTGSHLRLTTLIGGEHHITIPNHDELKIGTLNAILGEVGQHFKLSKAEIVEKLFK